MALLEIQNLSFRYPSRSNFELQGMNLTVEKGDLIGFLGSNGAGKSTILKLLGGLLAPSGGQVFLEGNLVRNLPPKERAKKIAFVPQSTQFSFALGVQEIVEMGRYPYLGRFQTLGAQDKAICERALKLCDALEFRDRFFDELSGGEKQRVLLASALAQTPEVLLLDEPTLSLDLSHQVLLFEIIQKLHREEGLTVLVATHELNWASRFLERIVLLKDGKVAASGKSQKVLNKKNIRFVLGVSVEPLGSRGRVPYFVPLPSRGVKVWKTRKGKA